MQTQIQTGISDGEWIEVTHRRVVSETGTRRQESWVQVDGAEQVILGDLSLLTDGAPVQVAKVARESQNLER